MNKTFNYSEFHLESLNKITCETYTGVFNKCNLDDESIIYSKPFTIKLYYKDNNILLDKELLSGDFSDDEIDELIETLK